MFAGAALLAVLLHVLFRAWIDAAGLYWLRAFRRRRRAAGKKKTLILDLDETLVHSTLKSQARCDLTVEVSIPALGTSYLFHVLKRPFVDHFLSAVAEWYEVIVFTASLKQYADRVVDLLDREGVVVRRYFRESCVAHGNEYVKDLARLGCDLSSTIIVDNSPNAYSLQPSNAVPIDAFHDDPHDVALLNLLPFLQALAHCSDVREILGRRLPAPHRTPSLQSAVPAASMIHPQAGGPPLPNLAAVIGNRAEKPAG